MIYLIPLIIAILGAFLNERLSTPLRKAVMITICICVVLIIGFRYRVGVDTLNYMNSYRFIPTLDQLIHGNAASMIRYEPGFLFICCLCKSLSGEFWTVQLIMASLTNSLIFYFLYRNCSNPFWGVILYFILQCLYFNTEIMRESAAVAIFLLNYKNLEEKKWAKYYLFSLLSMLFHYSAIVIWFFPFARWIRPNILFIILCVCFLAITPLVERLNTLLNIAAISGRIDQYVEGAKDLNLNWRLGELIRSAIPGITAILAFRYYKLPNRYQHMLLLQILFCMGAFAIPVIFSRFTNYTTLFVTVSIANLMTIPKVKIWLKVVVVLIMLTSQSYYYYSMRHTWLPYVSIFYPENIRERNQMYRKVFLQWMKKH